MLRISSCSWWFASSFCWIMKLAWQYIWTKLEYRNHKPRLQACVFQCEIFWTERSFVSASQTFQHSESTRHIRLPMKGSSNKGHRGLNICSESTGGLHEMTWKNSVSWFLSEKNYCSHFQDHLLSFLQCKLVPFSDTSLNQYVHFWGFQRKSRPKYKKHLQKRYRSSYFAQLFLD